jgi:uncharacterized protein (TIGR02217 family)
MFIDDRLLDFVAYGFRGGPTWATTKVGLVSGHVRRNAERSLPLYRFSAPYDRIKPEHHSKVISAYNACLGPVHSFRYKDRADFELDDVIIGTAVGGVDETMQIIKPYEFGPTPTVVNRVIKKPVDSTKYNIANGYQTDAVALSVTEDDGGGPVPLAHSVDYDTGILTFTSTATYIIRVTCEFDTPVMFDDDRLEFVYQTFKAHSAEIVLLEDFGA